MTDLPPPRSVGVEASESLGLTAAARSRAHGSRSVSARALLPRALAVVAFDVLLSLVLLEAVLAFALAFPSLLRYAPPKALGLFTHLYMRERISIQFLPECATYHPHLAYTLRPGTCVFSQREFSHEVRANSLGLRDDEVSLIAPAVIVLGDSVAMGWGVNQDDTFAQRLEAKTGLRVLNAGISSYGTAREMRLLDRLDTSGLRYLVIQYHENDRLENNTFREKQNDFPITDETNYKALVTRSHREKRYFPGRYTLTSLQKLLRLDPPPASSQPRRVPDVGEHVDLFINALLNGRRTDLRYTTVVVLAVTGNHDGQFLSALRDRAAAGMLQPILKELRTLDLSGRLTRRHLFLLDGHLNAAGHEVVAEALANMIRTDTRSTSGTVR